MLLYIEDEKQQVNIYTERAEKYTLSVRCNDYLNRLCEAYGSSLSGRKQAACAFLQIRQKVPIYIREGILLFQSIAAVTSRRIWINYYRVIQVIEVHYQTKFVFADHSELLTDMGYRSALMQMRRCFHYSYMMTMRWDQIKLENSEDKRNQAENQYHGKGEELLFA